MISWCTCCHDGGLHNWYVLSLSRFLLANHCQFAYDNRIYQTTNKVTYSRLFYSRFQEISCAKAQTVGEVSCQGCKSFDTFSVQIQIIINIGICCTSWLLSCVKKGNFKINILTKVYLALVNNCMLPKVQYHFWHEKCLCLIIWIHKIQTRQYPNKQSTTKECLSNDGRLEMMLIYTHQ